MFSSLGVASTKNEPARLSHTRLSETVASVSQDQLKSASSCRVLYLILCYNALEDERLNELCLTDENNVR